MLSSIAKFLPKTVTSQLMALIAIALIAAQLVNLLLLVGESRLRARANMASASIMSTVQAIPELPKLSELRLPHELRGSRYSNGRYYLSNNSRVAELDPGFRLNDHDRTLAKALDKGNISYTALEVALRPAGATDGRGLIAPDDRPHQFGDRRPPPPRHHPPDKSRLKQSGAALVHRPPPHSRPIHKRDPLSDHLIVSIKLQPGIWFNTSTPQAKVEALTPRILVATSALLMITLLSVAFFMRRISRPLSEFASAADSFGRGEDPRPLDEDGPRDIRVAAQAFNRMQRRLSRTIETQRTMLRAVGHDLRTPLTSLRIRSELIPQAQQREKFIATIDDMTQMTEDILDWAKNASGLEKLAPVDMKALLHSIVDDFTDQGFNVSIDHMNASVLNIRRLGLKRAITNIIGNSIKYAGSARVVINETTEYFSINIDDDGLGIAEDKLAEAVKPFVRFESSRNKQTGGAGLGLSIAESIMQTEGGKLLFKHLQPSGFRVTLVLPKH